MRHFCNLEMFSKVLQKVTLHLIVFQSNLIDYANIKTFTLRLVGVIIAVMFELNLFHSDFILRESRLYFYVLNIFFNA